MPADWDNARLENVKVGDNLLSINYVKNNDGYTLEVRSQNPDWNIEVTPQKGQIISKKTEYDQIIFNITDITNWFKLLKTFFLINLVSKKRYDCQN